ncbi:hypothetical protein G3I77_14755 [Streptomyces sp. D2-8]|uniref:stage II sporulation protein M n=1 Tax=Streptomyces sp. D2-8 TaxID=2707767 RepID=UPI0020BE6297|nr:stage II sporulation protein M [Streptomyces sp. D2-8]MCK8434239.1 hypothetical protein [Streptomyces sp. D2-8]
MTTFFGSVLARQRPALISGQLVWLLCLAIGVWLSGDIPSAVRAEPKNPGSGLFLGILVNNAGVAALAFTGIVTFGLSAIAFSLISGLGVGIFIGHAYSLGVGKFWSAFLPHAVIELPALGVSVAAGLVTGIAAARRMLGGRRTGDDSMSRHLIDAVVLFGLSLVMLVVAAGVETWISSR